MLPDPSRLPDLPVRAVLGAVTDAPAAHGSAVPVAPPGTGRTTLVPPALAAAGDPDRGRVLVAEPRRLATRAAALLGEPVGATVATRCVATRAGRTAPASRATGRCGAELRGRYPEHAWPEDPLQTQAGPPRRPG